MTTGLAYRLWIAACFLTTGTISPEIVPMEMAGLGANQLVYYPLSLALAAIAILNGSVFAHLRGPILIVLGIVMWSIVSALWSPLPGRSVLKGLSFLAGLLAACQFAARLDADHLLRGLCIGLMLAIGTSAILALAWPAIAGTTPYHPDAWRGLYGQKNVLGRICMIAVVFLVALSWVKESRAGNWPIWLGICTATLVMIRSQSMTAIIGAAIIVLMLTLSRALFFSGARARMAAILIGVPFAFALVLIGSTLFNDPGAALGRSADLTGRLPLWTYALESIGSRWWVGYGLDGFFQPRNDTALSGALGWLPEHAHNGFIDMALEIGVPATLAMVVALLWGAWLLVAHAHADKSLAVLGIATGLVLCVLNVTESNLYRSSNLVWMLLLVVTMKLAARRESASLEQCTGAPGRLGQGVSS